MNTSPSTVPVPVKDYIDLLDFAQITKEQIEARQRGRKDHQLKKWEKRLLSLSVACLEASTTRSAKVLS